MAVHGGSNSLFDTSLLNISALDELPPLAHTGPVDGRTMEPPTRNSLPAAHHIPSYPRVPTEVSTPFQPPPALASPHRSSEHPSRNDAHSRSLKRTRSESSSGDSSSSSELRSVLSSIGDNDSSSSSDAGQRDTHRTKNPMPTDKGGGSARPPPFKATKFHRQRHEHSSDSSANRPSNQRAKFPRLDGIESFKSVDNLSFVPRTPSNLPKSDLDKGILVVRRFQPMMLVGCKRTLILGMPGGGKSWTLLWLVNQMRNFYGAFVAINPSENSNQLYSSCLPNVYCHNVFDSKLCNRIVNRQSMAVGTMHNPTTLLIMDDCVGSRPVLACPAMQIMWLRGRHIGCAIIAASQYTVQLPPFCRSSVSYVILTLCNSGRDRKAVYDMWASAIFPTYNSFYTTYTKITNSAPYTHMVLALNNASIPPSECVFYLRAPSRMPETFDVGHPQYREWATSRSDATKTNVIPFMQHFT